LQVFIQVSNDPSGLTKAFGFFFFFLKNIKSNYQYLDSFVEDTIDVLQLFQKIQIEGK